jgi:hypothetical protein
LVDAFVEDNIPMHISTKNGDALVVQDLVELVIGVLSAGAGRFAAEGDGGEDKAIEGSGRGGEGEGEAGFALEGSRAGVLESEFFLEAGAEVGEAKGVGDFEAGVRCTGDRVGIVVVVDRVERGVAGGVEVGSPGENGAGRFVRQGAIKAVAGDEREGEVVVGKGDGAERGALDRLGANGGGKERGGGGGGGEAEKGATIHLRIVDKFSPECKAKRNCPCHAAGRRSTVRSADTLCRLIPWRWNGDAIGKDERVKWS